MPGCCTRPGPLLAASASADRRSQCVVTLGPSLLDRGDIGSISGHTTSPRSKARRGTLYAKRQMPHLPLSPLTPLLHRQSQRPVDESCHGCAQDPSVTGLQGGSSLPFAEEGGRVALEPQPQLVLGLWRPP